MLRTLYHILVGRLEMYSAHRSLRLLHILAVIFKNPLSVPGKARHKLHIYISDKRRARVDRLRPSYLSDVPAGLPRRLFHLPNVAAVLAHTATYAFLAQKTLNHEFDLLGSGWVNLQRGLRRAGVECPDGMAVYEPKEQPHTLSARKLAAGLSENNRNKATDLWKGVLGSYTPISWNEDFKSGFTWPADIPSGQQKYGDMPGADIKVPWELARMHHLPWLALAAKLATEGASGFAVPAEYAREFQNQVLDFAAACPPRFGANWVCAMDVGIRACNMLAAYDLFEDGCTVFVPTFKNEFLRVLNDHFEHLSSHLEYQPKVRANHYYSNVVCLLILCAWLPQNPRVTAALSWAVNEFFAETVLQFHADGSNFEASTSYHRLCGELMLYALAVLRGLDAHTLAALKHVDTAQWIGAGYYPAPLHKTPPLQDADGVVIPPAVLERSSRLAAFSLACRMEKRELLQIGDNDSGRLFKFLPSLKGVEGIELVNDHSHLLAAAWAWTGQTELEKWQDHPDSCILGRMFTARPAFSRSSMLVAIPLAWINYPDFGLYFHQRGRDVLAVRCGHNGQYDNGGHAHNDQLSISFARAGKLFLLDPGTWLYTPAPVLRNAFRATCNHNTVFLPGREQNDFSSASLFTLANQAQPKLLSMTENCFCAEHYGFPAPHRRTILFADGYTEICDEIALPGARMALCFHPDVSLLKQSEKLCIFERSGLFLKIVLADGKGQDWDVDSFYYSPAYGRKEPALRITSPEFSGKLVWRIE